MSCGRRMGLFVMWLGSALATLASGCRFDFATINLLVHQSADPERRRDRKDNTMRVAYALDEVREDGSTGAHVANGFSFSDDDVLESPPQRLKPYPQLLTMGIVVGAGAGVPLNAADAVGRVDALLVPSMDDGDVTLDARAFLAQPDVPEIVDAFTPAGGPQAMCDNRAGFVHAVGLEAAYSFNPALLALVSNQAGFSTNGDTVIACDVRDVIEDGVLQVEDGALVVAHGICAKGETTHTIVLDVGTNQRTLDDEPGALCDPFLRVVTLDDGTSLVWIATREFAALYDFADGALLGRQDLDPFLTGPVHHVLLDDGTLIASGFDNPRESLLGSVVRRISDAALQPGEPTIGLDRMIAGDPSGVAALFDDAVLDDGAFTLRVPKVDDANAVSDEASRPVQFEAGFVPTRIVVLGGDDDDFANDVVVGMDDAGFTQVEGGNKLNTGQNGIAIAFGRAVILAGNAAGHKVLVRNFDDDEVALLDPPNE